MYIAQGSLDELSYSPVLALFSECNTLIYGTKGKASNNFLNVADIPESVKTIVLSNNNNSIDKEFYKRFLQYGKVYAYPKRLKLK